MMNIQDEGFPPYMYKPMHAVDPKLVIVRQPKKRGYRFRYHSEGQTHGGIPGEPDKANDKAKCFPTIKLLHYDGSAKIVLTLVSADKSIPYLHPHSLIIDKQMTKGYHIIDMAPHTRTIELKSVAIQHVVKDNLQSTMMRRILATRFVQQFGWNSGLNNGIDHSQFDVEFFERNLQDANDITKPLLDRNTARAVAGIQLEDLKMESKNLKIVMNQVRLCFQAFLPDENGKFTKILEPVYSDIIYDGKTKQGAALKIIRISSVSCSVAGNEEVWVIADKLNADDIEVRFFEDAWGDSQQAWESFGMFNKTEIFKQCVLIFKTPPYRDQNIRQPMIVWIQLRRKNDKSCFSEPMEFKYTPIHHDRYGIGEKRKKTLNARSGFAYLAPSATKRRYEEEPQPIADLPSNELLVNADAVENYASYDAPPFIMSNDSSLFNLPLKQEDITDETTGTSVVQPTFDLSQLTNNTEGQQNGQNRSFMSLLSSLVEGNDAVGSASELPAENNVQVQAQQQQQQQQQQQMDLSHDMFSILTQGMTQEQLDNILGSTEGS